MKDKYLLYIDLLGFSDLAETDPDAVDEIYAIEDSLTVHKHEGFRTIVFSDTIFVYNKYDASTKQTNRISSCSLVSSRKTCYPRFVGKDRFFRAVLTYGPFDHYRLKNTECFYGPALISSYQEEKLIQSHGLFIDNHANHYNRIFKTAPYDDALNFVYLTQALERFLFLAQGCLPIHASLLNGTDEAYNLMPEIRYMQDIYYLMHTQRDPKVRTKHITAWHFFRSRYYMLLDELERHRFRPETISPEYDWSQDIAFLDRDHQCSIGLNSDLKSGK